MSVDLSNFTDEELETLLLQMQQQEETSQVDQTSEEPAQSSNTDLSLLSDEELLNLAREKRPYYTHLDRDWET